MKTYYFGVIATSYGHVSQSFYAVAASHYDSAERSVCIETEWLWSDPRNSFQMFQLSKFLFDRLKAKSQVDGIVVGQKVAA